MAAITVRDYTDADAEDAWRVRRLAFGGPRQPPASLAFGGSRDWVAELDGRLCAYARALPYQQFFGGVPVPMAGLASVAVDPHVRGRGVASALLDHMLPRLREAGQPLSALYASVPQLYRGRGWEQVGVTEWVEVPTTSLRAVAEPSVPVPLRPASAHDLPALHECYLRLAATVDGMLTRTGAPFELSRVLDFDVVTVADGPSGLRGYVTAERGDPGLVVYDHVAHDPDARLALLRSLASWAGQLQVVRLRLLEPRSLLPVDLPFALSSEQWMFRVVDLPAAVAARGWPHAAHLRPGLAVDLDVIDEHAPWHAGQWRVEVSDGGVLVRRGGTGAVQLNARGLAAWFAAAASAAALRRAGLLAGDPAAAAVLDALTGAAGTPRMADTF